MMYNLNKVNKIKTQHGFTILELLVVVMIIGIFVTIIVPAFNSIVEATRAKVCIATQRTLYEAAALYELNENDFLDDEGGQKARLDKLVSVGYIKSNKSFECPSSGVQDYDDYIMIFENSSIVDIECQLERNKHKWP